jgi:hypothetical protein
VIPYESGIDVRHPGKLHVADPAAYLIRVFGEFDTSWAAALGEMGMVSHDLDTDCDITTLRGRVTDQAALLGILNLAFGLGMQLLSVEYLPDQQS